MDMDYSLYLPKEYDLAMWAMFATHFWEMTYGIRGQLLLSTKVDPQCIVIRTARLQVIDLLPLAIVYPLQTAQYYYPFIFTQLVENFSRL